MQEYKIKAAITETLRPLEYCGKKFQAELAEKLYAAIAPHFEVSPDWAEAPEWAEWRIFDPNGKIAYSEKFPYNTKMQVPQGFAGTIKVEKRPE